MSVITQFIRNTAYQSFNDFFLRIIAAVTGIVIIRFLPKDEYGLLALIMAIVGMANLLSNLGYPTMIVKSISQHYAADQAKAASYYRFTLKVYGAITLLFAASLYLLAPVISKAYGIYYAANFIKLSAALFLLLSMFSFYNWTFIGLNQIKTFFLKVCIPKEVLTLILIVVFLYLGVGIPGVIFAQILGAVAAVILAVLVVRSRLKGNAEIDKKWIVHGALEVAPANLAYATTVYMDIIIIGAILGTSLLASYRVCLAAVQIAVGLFPIGAFIMPTFHQMGRDEAKVLLGDILKLTFILALPAMLLIAAFSKEIIIVLFGKKYIDAYVLLSLFSFLLLGQFVESIVLNTMTYLERFKSLSKIWALMALFNAALLIVFTKFVGLTGAVIATIILHYTLAVLMCRDVSRNGMDIKFKPLLEILILGSPLLINIIGIGRLDLGYRTILFVSTCAVYVLLLRVRGVFRDLELLKEVRSKLR